MSINDTESKSSQKSSRGLGRGLGSLLGNNAMASNVPEVEIASNDEKIEIIERHKSQEEDNFRASRVWNIDIEKLKPNTQQPRNHFEKSKLEELTQSVKLHGIMNPIVAQKRSEGGFEIVAGERRWRAAQSAGLKQVPVILKEIDLQKSLELALIENIQRHDLNPLEEAHAYKKLMEDYGLTQAEVAERVGKERSTVANLVRLLLLPPEVAQMIGSGEISTGHAKLLLGMGDAQKQIGFAKKIHDGKLSVRAAEKLLRLESVPGASVKKEPSQDEKLRLSLTKSLQEELQKLIGSKVEIDYKKSKGKISLHFYSDEQLNHFTGKIKDAWLK